MGLSRRGAWTAAAERGSLAALGERLNGLDVFRPVHEFAQNLRDRLFVWSGEGDLFCTDEQGTGCHGEGSA